MPSRASRSGGLTLATDLLDHAETLLTLDPTATGQVHLRRATSAAYYGLFHDLLIAARRGQGVHAGDALPN